MDGAEQGGLRMTHWSEVGSENVAEDRANSNTEESEENRRSDEQTKRGMLS